MKSFSYLNARGLYGLKNACYFPVILSLLEVVAPKVRILSDYLVYGVQVFTIFLNLSTSVFTISASGNSISFINSSA